MINRLYNTQSFNEISNAFSDIGHVMKFRNSIFTKFLEIAFLAHYSHALYVHFSLLTFKTGTLAKNETPGRLFGAEDIGFLYLHVLACDYQTV